MQYIKVDEMNLYDYVMNTFDRICDLTLGRINSLNYVLGNVSARFVNVGLFKSVFKVNSFEEIVALITNIDKFEEMHAFGLLCRNEVEKDGNIINHGVTFSKKC